MKRIAILQSDYLPWIGYFNNIKYVDEFILYDEAQYTRNARFNRNQFKTARGVHWLIIPVYTSNKFGQSIREAKVFDPKRATEHYKTICQSYAKALYLKEHKPVLKDLYDQAGQIKCLSDINYLLLTEMCRFLGILGIDTKIAWGFDYDLVERQTERLVSLVASASGDSYLSGLAAQDYTKDELFERAGIKLENMSYEGYTEYPQLHGDFVYAVSVLDLLLMKGPDSHKYMLSFK